MKIDYATLILIIIYLKNKIYIETEVNGWNYKYEIKKGRWLKTYMIFLYKFYLE